MTIDQGRFISNNGSIATTAGSAHPMGKDARIAEDLLVSFETESGFLAERTRLEIQRWAISWLTRHPGAVVVMACNGQSRNSLRNTREARLQSLTRTLADFGVSEERVRYTDDVVELAPDRNPIPAARGVACMRVLRSTVLDSAVMPIRDLFLSANRVGDGALAIPT